MKNFKNFADIKVLIVGDVMIDRYWWGNVERISPEAPVPVVRHANTSLIAGGAANVAANVAGLGAVPYLIGIVGRDAEAELFPALLTAAKINHEFLIKSKTRPTTVKTRIIAHSQQVARIDRESNAKLTSEEENDIWLSVKKLFELIDIIILSDYAKGVLTDELISRVLTAAKLRNKLVLIDPKGKNFLKYKGASLLTPNQKEVVEACALENADEHLIEQAAAELLKSLDLENLLVTQGEKGMTLFGKNKLPIRLSAAARKVYDVTGAGDTVIATLSIALGSGMSIESAARLANTAAGKVVEQLGTTAIQIKDLEQSEVIFQTEGMTKART